LGAIVGLLSTKSLNDIKDHPFGKIQSTGGHNSMDAFTVGADFATTASESLQAVDFDPWCAGYRTGASVERAFPSYWHDSRFPDLKMRIHNIVGSIPESREDGCTTIRTIASSCKRGNLAPGDGHAIAF
jgi:hypothetical protein